MTRGQARRNPAMSWSRERQAPDHRQRLARMHADDDGYAKRRRRWFDFCVGFTCAMGLAVIFWALLAAA